MVRKNRLLHLLLLEVGIQDQDQNIEKGGIGKVKKTDHLGDLDQNQLEMDLDLNQDLNQMNV